MLTRLLGLATAGLLVASIWTAPSYPVADKLMLTACVVGIVGLLRWAAT